MPGKSIERVAILLKQTLQKIREGRITQARALCEQALQLAPGNPDALHLMGVMALQGHEHATALDYLQRAVAVQPRVATYWANLAYARTGLNQHAEALAAFEQAARLAPAEPEWQLAAGNCLALLGRTAEAEAIFRQLVARHPDFALIWFNLGNVLKDQNRYEEARESYMRVTQLAPQFAEAWCNLGIALHKLDRFEEAARSFRASLARNPDFAAAHFSLAITLNSLGRHAEAEAACRETLAREPGQKSVWSVLGKAIAAQRRWSEALHCFERAVQEFPDDSDTLYSLGTTLFCTGRYGEAVEALDRACASDNAPSHARFVRAYILHLLGRTAEAAIDYAGRHDRSAFLEQHPEIVLATDLPRNLQGLKVCLIGEQGIGDQIFFLRYASQLKARGCRVTYYGTRKILDVLSRIPALDEVLPWAKAFPPADYTVFIGDLAALLGGGLDSSPIGNAGGLPGARPGYAARDATYPRHFRVYWPELPPPLKLQPLLERVADVTRRLALLGPPPYIGLTWRAGRGPEEQRGEELTLFKEISLEVMAGALKGVSGTLIALQRQPVSGEIEKLAALTGKPVHDESAANEYLEEILALLTVVDEYVGVSSTNMHLRVGLGKPARVLVPWPPDWRWMAAGDESPWFPQFRIYRQKFDENWSDAIGQLGHDLAQSLNLPQRLS